MDAGERWDAETINRIDIVVVAGLPGHIATRSWFDISQPAREKLRKAINRFPEMSQAEKDALKYTARDRDFIATTGLHSAVEAIPLKSGMWRAYVTDFVTPGTPRGQAAESKEVVKDNYGYIITEATRELLIIKLKQEYPGWKWR